MAAIKGKDTKPEMIIRKYLFSKGLRFRVHVKKLAGSPDIVLPKYKTVIFVNGCFWHGHDGCKYSRLPKTNEFFWEQKIRRNKARDIANEYVLQTEGWRVIRVWECEIKKVAGMQERLESLYNQILRTDSSDNFEENPVIIAAEPEEEYQ
ncbi:MAG: DNA mismatch endonuclease Vsr [Muribaculaceae bacterium]|nr:DNA mismatch endonuclease Vsr [Muribaculaceae bacterium]